MFLSICMPCFNRGYIIERAIESVLHQTEEDWELLIVDDGSTDDTVERIKKYEGIHNLKYMYKENGGKHTAINAALDIAKGDYFMILDSDDMLAEDCIWKMKLLLKNNSQALPIVGGGSR